MPIKKNPKLPNPRLKQLYDFIVLYVARNNYSPCIREMCEDTGIPSTSVVNYYLDQLEKMGKIQRQRKISRGISIVDQNKEIIVIFRCPKYPTCDIHDWQEGHCIQHEKRLVPVTYKEV